MGSVLLFVQQQDGVVAKASLCALRAAREVGGDIYGICLGAGSKQAAESLGGYGLKAVSYSEAAEFEKYLAGNFDQAVLQYVDQVGATTVIAAATSTGKDLFPRIAAALDAGQASDIVSVNSDGTFKRPMYAGDAFADVEITTEKKVITVRATAFAPAEAGGGDADIQEETFRVDAGKSGEFVSAEISGGERPELGDAEVVVSGGRALESSENFEKIIFPLADALGAAVGASRAAVDSGYAPNDWQVGQTGKIVAPNLYIAVGISGAIQHIAGMKDSKVIVAINKDPEAPIYDVADYGLVADLYEVVPQLTEALQKI